MRLEEARATLQAEPRFPLILYTALLLLDTSGCHAWQLSRFLFFYKSPCSGRHRRQGKKAGLWHCASYWLIGSVGPGARLGLLRGDVFNVHPSLVDTPVDLSIRTWRMMVCCARLNEQEKTVILLDEAVAALLTRFEGCRSIPENDFGGT